MTILITGGAGFVGYHVAKRLLACTEHHVVIIDNLNRYYSVALKKARLRDLGIDSQKRSHISPRLSYYCIDISDGRALNLIFERYRFDIVINLAAQAGVRNTEANPMSYIESNVVGFLNVLECAKRYEIRLMLYASSSSVYGSRIGDTAFSEDMPCESPLSLYAATKLSSELIAKAYSLMGKTRFIGMRFFNVYGPWGRPDMAYFSWARALKNSQPIIVYGKGEMLRDMTYVDDVVTAILRLIDRDINSRGSWLRHVTEATQYINHTIFNIGNAQPIAMQYVLDFLTSSINPAPEILYEPRRPEEALMTRADTTKLNQAIGFVPDTDIDYGLCQFISWFQLSGSHTSCTLPLN